MQAATLARGSGRPASLYLARSKSISSSNPDLAVVPGSVDDEVSRILASKVGQASQAWLQARCRCRKDHLEVTAQKVESQLGAQMEALIAAGPVRCSALTS